MSKIRFLKTTSNYPNYISAFVEKHPEMNEMSYKDALEFYLNDCNSWAYYWKLNLEALGNFECAEIIENAEMLQKKWAKENKFAYDESNWKKEILTEQIKQFQPDILFLVDQYNDNSLSYTIKKNVPSIKLILGWDGILWHKPETFINTDIILTCVPETADFYEKSGKTAYYHKFGFETTILDKLVKNKTPYNVSFAGSLVLSKNYHMNRLKMVAELSRKIDLEVWASSLPVNWSIFQKNRFIHTIRTSDYRFALDLNRVGSKNRGEVFGLDMFNVLNNSKIVFNTHGDNSIATAANMRMTEATGVGALLLTDWKENLHELFVPDEEVVAYKSTAEAIDKIKMLLANETLRKTIAERGQLRTLKDYSYKKRMEQFADFIIKFI